MCGRTALMLDPGVICKACTYKQRSAGSNNASSSTTSASSPKSKGSKKATKTESKSPKRKSKDAFVQPNWQDHPATSTVSSTTYFPSANMPPTRFTPIMIKGENGQRIIQPMMWSLIPFWHKGDPKAHRLSTNNCRLEGILTSKLYKRVLNQRKLCVVLAQGFYEWKASGKKSEPKQPYFITIDQGDKKVDVTDLNVWNTSEWDESNGWQGPKILMMAGLYDVWKSEGGEEVYSYAIITMDSNKTLSWLHERMPAILETVEQVDAWLDSSPDTPVEELISVLKPATHLYWHPVSTKVNSSRCHDTDCMNKLEQKEKPENKGLSNWLKRGPPKAEKSDPSDSVIKEEDGPSGSKKVKKEEPI